MNKLSEAQNVAFRLVNLNSDKVTLEEIKQALIILANFYEDNKYLLKENKIEELQDEN